MGSDFVSPVDAAKLLGRTRRTVTEYMKAGVLRRVRDGKRTLIPRSDVDQLAVELGANCPPMNRKTFYSLAVHVQKLEQDMAVLKLALNYFDAPLRPTKEEGEALYQMAVRAGQEGRWQVGEIGMWADQYEKMDDVFFDQMGTHVGRSDTWRPFYELCLRQTGQISGEESFKTSLSLQKLHERLLAALKRMRGVILVWIEAGNSSRTDQALTILDGRKEAVTRLIEQKHRASGT